MNGNKNAKGHKKRGPVEHHIEGRHFWRYGKIGYLLRIRGILITLGTSIAFLTGPPWWIPKLLPMFMQQQYTFSQASLSTSILLYFSVLLILGLIYLRKRTMRSLDIKYYLHQIAHQIRDKESEIYKSIIPNRDFSTRKIEKNLKAFLNQMVGLIKRYFQILLQEKNIDVAIRLASIHKEDVAYKTYARSSGLNPRREKSSEPIFLDEGIVRKFRSEKGCQGILIYNDIDQAAKEGDYKLTINDRNFPDDIITMMVAPMNSWQKGSIDMIGLLYITAKKRGLFSAKDVDSLAFVADMLSCSISNIVNIIEFRTSSMVGEQQ